MEFNGNAFHIEQHFDRLWKIKHNMAFNVVVFSEQLFMGKECHSQQLIDNDILLLSVQLKTNTALLPWLLNNHGIAVWV